ncbi:MAG TPA: biotin--[acetyl-CoA-carboxylase] ligase [Gaiellaceae bacterium]|nr:biotin--[acetyl-CoA-carboxylase] ligase [Gaiellaceae bacterium]
MRIHVPECETTQALLEPAMPEWSVATTGHQTGGRGRLGRTWVDEPGTSLLVSVLLKPPRDPAELTLVAGVAVAQVVERAIGRPAQIKWPNDVLVDGAKVSGGIAELRDGAVVLGIGLNVNQTTHTSLKTIDGQERELEPLLDDLLATLRARYDDWLVNGLPHDEIAARDFLRGKRISVNGLEGEVVGIRPDGRLELDTGVVDSGSVEVVRDAGVA